MQTNAKTNLAFIQATLKSIDHPDHEMIELPGLNHLFQTGSSGEFYEYPTIEETLAPQALETLRSWLDNRFQPD